MLKQLMEEMQEQAGVDLDEMHPGDEPSKVPPRDRKRIASLWQVWPLSIKQNKELYALEMKYFGKSVHSHMPKR